MSTTITVNGAVGLQFLSSMERAMQVGRPLPRALERLMRSEDPSIEVDAELADELAAFVDELAARGLLRGSDQPLLFSPGIGDEVVIVRDALLELQPSARRAPRRWCLIARGTRARLVARHGELGRLVLNDGPYAGEIAFASERSMTRARVRRMAR